MKPPEPKPLTHLTLRIVCLRCGLPHAVTSANGMSVQATGRCLVCRNQWQRGRQPLSPLH